jgi:aspartyl-tRNA(Asn)/glutamyl-tRNA(Gln) amidotransferase subunit C
MAVSKDDVKKLAELSRIELSDEEVTKMQGEIDSILEYVDVIQKVELPDGVSPSPHLDLENVMREDGEPHEGGVYTEIMLSQAPKRNGDFLEVKKIIGGD